MKAIELRKKSTSELQEEHFAMNKELFNLRIQRGIGQVQQTHRYRDVKRNIARIKTILREKEGSL
jgi:large subunit ribosomal protein L29